MPFIEIDGKKIEAETGSMIIEVADAVHIQIPRFCYHKKLSIAANCRMCLVEVERSPKPLPACATPVTEGMKIWTRSPMALLAQKSVMEFLLINHPLDCPICDQGGECELQDLSMGYGSDASRYTEGKRVVQDKNLGPLISTDMTRCIQCTRCVRFGTEIAGVREMGATGKGECMEIGTYIERSVDSEVSGNIIDLCPVGALTSKPYRFTARGWELKQSASIAPHDCIGSHLYIHTRRNQVMRVVPKENELINEVWISDRDRYSYEGLYHEQRLTQPKLKKKGQWEIVSWEEALSYAAKCLQNANSSLGAVISPNATVEEGYLAQKIMRGLGSHHIDHRLRQSDFRHQEKAPLFPNLGIPLSEIENQSVIILVGSAIRQEQPILGIKLRKMTLSGGKVLVVNPIDFEFNFEVIQKSIVPGGDLVSGLTRIEKALLDNSTDQDIAQHLQNDNPQKLILLGALATSHPEYSQIMILANRIGKLIGAKVGILSDGANSAGLWLSGCVPHRLPGGKKIEADASMDINSLWHKKLKNYLLFNIEPELDCLNGPEAMQILSQAEHVVAITPFESQSLLAVADVLLPMVPFTETSGTFVNIEGKWQSFKPTALPMGDSRPGWKILRVLGNLLDLKDFEYQSSEEIAAIVKSETDNNHTVSTSSISEMGDLKRITQDNQPHKITCIAPVGLYATDGLVRRAKSLQATQSANMPAISFNSAMANHLKLVGGHVKVTIEGVSEVLAYAIDETVPDNTVLMPGRVPYVSLDLERV